MTSSTTTAPQYRSVVRSRAVPTGVRGRRPRRRCRIVASHQDAACVALKSRLEARGKLDKAQAPSNADHLSHCERTAAKHAAMAVGYKQEWNTIGGGNASHLSTALFIHLAAIATLLTLPSLLLLPTRVICTGDDPAVGL